MSRTGTGVVALAAALATACCSVEVSTPPGGAKVVIRSDIRDLVREDLPPFEVETGAEPRLTVDAETARVTVRAREGTGITVRAAKLAPTREDLDAVEVLFERDGEGNVTVRQRRLEPEPDLQAEIEVEVPPGTRVRVDTGAGSVRVEGIRADLRVRSGAGSLEVSGAGGAVDLETGAGSVEVDGAGGAVRVRTGGGSVEVAGAGGPLDLETGAGSIEVRRAPGPVRAKTGGGQIRVEDARGDLRLETRAGSIHAEGVDGRVEVESGGGSIRLEGRIRGESSARTGAGSVEVAVPADAGLAVEARTGAGSLEGPDGPVRDGRLPAREARWTVGDGAAATLRLESGGGSIRLRVK